MVVELPRDLAEPALQLIDAGLRQLGLQMAAPAAVIADRIADAINNQAEE